MHIKILQDMAPWEWPEGAYEVITRLLCDRGAEGGDRLKAAELSGSEVVMDDGLAEILLSIARDEDEAEELRCEAALALGPALGYGYMSNFSDSEDIMLSEQAYDNVREGLRDIYVSPRTPVALRRNVLEASARAPMQWHIKAITEAYAVDDEEWRMTAVFCMGYVRGFEEQILENFDNDDPDIFYEAVCAAGNREIEDAWPHIKVLLTSNDTEKFLLLAAIEAATFICPDQDMQILIDLAASRDEDISESANEVLIMRGAGIDFYNFKEDGDPVYH